jgi:hypothetical protein
MKQILIIKLLIILSGTVVADTIDIWTMKINDSIVINSNQSLIESGTPMELNIDTLSGSDTIKVVYFSDTHLHTKRWGLIILDDNMQPIDTVKNKFDVNNYQDHVVIPVNKLKNYFKAGHTRYISCRYILLSGRVVETYNKDIICRFNTK